MPFFQNIDQYRLIKNWKNIPLQKKHNAYQWLVLLWKSHSWSSPRINFHLCLEHIISAIDSPYLRQVSQWSISSKFWHKFCCCGYTFYATLSMFFKTDNFPGVRSLSSLLRVLYRFLDYYCKVDWDNKGITLFVLDTLSSLIGIISEWTLNYAVCSLAMIEITSHLTWLFVHDLVLPWWRTTRNGMRCKYKLPQSMEPVG